VGCESFKMFPRNPLRDEHPERCKKMDERIWLGRLCLEHRTCPLADMNSPWMRLQRRWRITDGLCGLAANAGAGVDAALYASFHHIRSTILYQTAS